jgi:glutamyl-tRNA synthetase
MTAHVRTRFAPSPTGFIHLGNLRSALYPWAFARKMKGDFVLRIEDTDIERSSQAAVDVILEGLAWLGLDIDEGPIYQTQRMPRYRAVIQQMLAEGLAYPCYMSNQELDELREAQRLRGEKPRYDGRWRPAPGKVLPTPPSGVAPVIRFCNPLVGEVSWPDAVKGQISISNTELDDLIIARADGTPTYNFCVVIDDLDMQITHVIRGDDHVNNTPRQINIIRALGGTPPVYAHLPTVLNELGEKMSKRHGAMSVRDYQQAGYLPEAILNYLARLGWAHGDEEIFTREQFVAWFDLEHLGKSSAQHNPAKLTWLNTHYLKQADNQRLAALVAPYLIDLGADLTNGPALIEVVALFKDRADTLRDIAQQAMLFYQPLVVAPDLLSQHLSESIEPALIDLRQKLSQCTWQRDVIAAIFKEVLTMHNIKMPKLAMPVRVLVCGQTQTPAIDAVLALFKREVVLERLRIKQ